METHLLGKSLYKFTYVGCIRHPIRFICVHYVARHLKVMKIILFAVLPYSWIISDRRDLSQHKLIHSGERKYICKVCNKAFNRMSNLRVHERIHSGLKPYSCYICHKGFIQKHVLTTHLKTHPNALN